MKRPEQTAYKQTSLLEQSKKIIEDAVEKEIFSFNDDEITTSKDLDKWLKSYGWALVPEFEDDVKILKLVPL